MPRDEQFFDELEAVSAHLLTAASELSAMVVDAASTAAHATAADRAEQDANALVQRSLVRLDQAFVTPLDREDIFSLLSLTARTTKAAAGLARRIDLFQASPVEQSLVDQIGTFSRMAQLIDRMMRCLRQSTRLSSVLPELEQVHRLEVEADDRRRAVLASLFTGEPDPIGLIKRRELHDVIERAIDHADQVARAIQRTLLRNG